MNVKNRLLFFLTLSVGAVFLGWVVLANLHEYHNEWNQIRGTFFTNVHNWKTTTGRIQISEVYSETAGYRLVPFTTYRYRIRYTFQAGDRSYVSQRVSFASDGFPVRKDATLYNYLYPAGATIIVYYDPANPELSVLDPEKTADNLEAVGFLLLYAAGIGSALAVIALHGMRKGKPPAGSAHRHAEEPAPGASALPGP
ncbi:MAG: DUF3592 domain-containing protein [Anaerolineales bacterium]|nr:DUF3592 domain-containing protein [Anaerolineales bacterium]